MPKMVNRPSKEEIKAANEKDDKRDAPETRWYYRGNGKPGRDYSEAHERRLAELKSKADPACPKCGGEGHTTADSKASIHFVNNGLDKGRMVREEPSLFSFPYKRPCSCTEREP